MRIRELREKEVWIGKIDKSDLYVIWDWGIEKSVGNQSVEK